MAYSSGTVDSVRAMRSPMRHACIVLCLALSSAAHLAAAPGDAAAAATPALAEMDSYLAKAQDAADSNHLSEAIRSYVTVLALADTSPSPDAKSKADQASAELARIGSRLTLEPASEWVDPKGTQIAASSRSLGKDGGLSPAVYLYENYGTGKSPVADAPVYFQFVKNSGSLVAFQAVFRDFAYLPPANVVRVIALESSELGVSDSPRTVDPAAAVLKQTGLEVLPFNAKLAPDDFRDAYSGQAKALAALGVDAASPYAAFVLVEVAPARQMELNGKIG